MRRKVVIYAKASSALTEEIKRIAEENTLFGHMSGEIVKLDLANISCIAVMDNRIHALCGKDWYLLKERLYVLEEKLPENFVRINQSCLANIRQMKKFDASISGTLKITFKNGYVDYVSRGQLKLIKQRIGNKYFKGFLRRGLLFGGFGPMILGIIYAILTIKNFALNGSQILIAILSVYLLAFVQAGASVFNQIESFSLPKALSVT